MKKLPTHIKVKITEKDVKESEGYTSNTDCFLATALKRTKKFKNILVYSADATIDDTRYVMSEFNCDRLAYIGIKEPFKPFVVTLTKRLKTRD